MSATVNVEKISHIKCDQCFRNFSVFNAPYSKTNWFCAWCGKELEIEQPVSRSKPAYSRTDDTMKHNTPYSAYPRRSRNQNQDED